MMRKGTIVSLLMLVNSYVLISQMHNYQEGYFIPPVKIPIFLSGNFGEIRSNHFHAGIDIKTQGVTGHEIIACADGYVSRIKIRGNGYGKALYIQHPNGYTTVYGHLEKFNKTIHDYAINKQYKQKKFEVDIYLKKDEIPVKQGDIIAYSGNSGSSSGPHLHFEIRDVNQCPLNVLQFNMPVKDNIKPTLKRVYFYPLDDDAHINGKSQKTIFDLIQHNGKYKLNTGIPVNVYGKIGIGIEAYDYLNGARNRCGIYSVHMIINDIPVYAHKMDGFCFHESRYVNAHLDFEERVKRRRNIHKTFLLPNNNLPIYETNNKYTHGILINDTFNYKVNMIIKDVHGNSSLLNFTLQGSPQTKKNTKPENKAGKFMPYNQKNVFKRNDIVIEFPANTLYENLYFNYAKTSSNLSFYSPIHHLHDEYAPLHKSMSVSLKCINLPENLRDKALIARVNGKNMLSAVGGQWENDFVTARTSVFGKYIVTVDTLKPTVIPVNFQKGKNMQNQGSIRFYIKDNLSGIKNFNGYIDDQWALFEYDPKGDVLFFNFSDARLEKNKEHSLKLIVDDYYGNINTYVSTFYW